MGAAINLCKVGIGEKQRRGREVGRVSRTFG